MPLRFANVILTATIATVALSHAALAQDPQFMRQFKDWAAYSFEDSNKKICFAVSQPRDTQTNNLDRGEVYFYVSDWPRQNVRAEVSVQAGYQYKPGSTTTAVIGSNVFEMFTDGDKAFVQSPDQERNLVNAMRRGSKMEIRGRSNKGTETIDVYSLAGVTAAINHVRNNCK